MAVTRITTYDNAGAAAGEQMQPLAQLTPTQIKVMHGVHCGLLNKQIAFDLGIAEATVKAHMTALMRKLNVRNRTQVAVAAQSLNPSPLDRMRGTLAH
jgi:DNA-binding NarL/FixJ family response regulator